jgi:RNA polymerase sigma-70 factor (ECF subfamily)
VDPSDAQLVAALRHGERWAFDAVYARHHARIWDFLARLAGDRAGAEDLYQETWLAAAAHAARLAPDSDILPWLYTIARNKYRSARRFALFDRRRREAVAVTPLALVRTPDDELTARRRARALAAAFAGLGDAHREVLLLCAVEDLETPQVAAILALSEAAVRKRLSRARATLAAAIDRRDGEAHEAARGGRP